MKVSLNTGKYLPNRFLIAEPFIDSGGPDLTVKYTPKHSSDSQKMDLSDSDDTSLTDLSTASAVPVIINGDGKISSNAIFISDNGVAIVPGSVAKEAQEKHGGNLRLRLPIEVFDQEYLADPDAWTIEKSGFYGFRKRFGVTDGKVTNISPDGNIGVVQTNRELKNQDYLGVDGKENPEEEYTVLVGFDGKKYVTNLGVPAPISNNEQGISFTTNSDIKLPGGSVFDEKGRFRSINLSSNRLPLGSGVNLQETATRLSPTPTSVVKNLGIVRALELAELNVNDVIDGTLSRV